MAHMVNSELAAAPSDFNYVQLRKLTYIDANGATRQWEIAARSHKGSHFEERSHSANLSDSDVVIVIATILYPRSGRLPDLLLMKQFRPSVNAEVAEFVAGLCSVDGGDVISCARREILEKVGYTGVKVTSVSSRPMAIDAGLSSSTAAVVLVEVDGDNPQNPQANRNLRCIKSHSGDEDVRLSAVRIPLHTLTADLLGLEREGCVVGSMVWSYAYGRAACPVGSQPIEESRNSDPRPFPPRQSPPLPIRDRGRQEEKTRGTEKRETKPVVNPPGHVCLAGKRIAIGHSMKAVVGTAAAAAVLYIALKCARR